MKLLFREYTASMGERRDLERFLPDVLSERGFTVLSRPGRGTRQYGVDVLARGPDPEFPEREANYLITIKGGDIGRTDWDAPEQGVRTSLNEIVDVYIPTHLPDSGGTRRKIIVVACGGEIKEPVRLAFKQVSDRIAARYDDTVVIEWNGDHLADLLLSGLLREEVFGPDLVSTFRKALAFCDEPEICERHFVALLDIIAQRDLTRRRDQLRAVRQILVALYTLYGWCLQADNLESAYRASEAATLHAWEIARAGVGVRGSQAKSLFDTAIGIANLHLNIADAFLTAYVRPCLTIVDGLSSAVPSSAAIDVNLQVFDTLGRLAMFGHWKHQEAYARSRGELDFAALGTELRAIADDLEALIDNNPVCLSPATDFQVTAVDLAAHLLVAVGRSETVGNWLCQMSRACQIAYKRRSHFPVASALYDDLARMEVVSEECRESLTQASVLWPTLQLWLARVGTDADRRELDAFMDEHLGHCSCQFWVPGTDSEAAIWRNTAPHGIAVHELSWDSDPESKLRWVSAECEAHSAFYSLSAVRAAMWCMVLAACRRYQFPVPLHLHGLLSGVSDQIEAAHMARQAASP